MFAIFKSQLAAAPAAAGPCALALAAVFLLAHCKSTPSSEVVVSVKDQKLGLYADGKLVKKYVISTSKFGLGDKPGSCCTPLGKHEVVAKIGHGLPPGAVLKSRSWNGEVLKPNAEGRDPIVSRILWLKGLEGVNKNAFKRYIYIHGTPEEKNLGQPASYGCIRMGMKDVVSVFNDVSIGAKVVITKGALPHGKKGEEQPMDEAGVPDAAAIASTAKAADSAKGGARKKDSAPPAEAPVNPENAKVVKGKKDNSKSQRVSASHGRKAAVKSKEHS